MKSAACQTSLGVNGARFGLEWYDGRHFRRSRTFRRLDVTGPIRHHDVLPPSAAQWKEKPSFGQLGGRGGCNGEREDRRQAHTSSSGCVARMDQNNNFRPISPTRGAVWVPRIFPKLPLVNVVLGLPSTG